MNSLPKTVTQQRRDCDLNPGPSVPVSSTLTTRLSSHPKRRSNDEYHFDMPMSLEIRLQRSCMRLTLRANTMIQDVNSTFSPDQFAFAPLLHGLIAAPVCAVADPPTPLYPPSSGTSTDRRLGQRRRHMKRLTIVIMMICSIIRFRNRVPDCNRGYSYRVLNSFFSKF